MKVDQKISMRISEARMSITEATRYISSYPGASATPMVRRMKDSLVAVLEALEIEYRGRQ